MFHKHQIKIANKQNHQLRWDMNTPMEDNNRKRKGDRHDQRAKRPPPQPTGPCWFCKYNHKL